MTGTDEHGLKIQQAAKMKGLDPKSFCDELSQHFRVGKNRICYPKIEPTFRKESSEKGEYKPYSFLADD